MYLSLNRCPLRHVALQQTEFVERASSSEIVSWAWLGMVPYELIGWKQMGKLLAR